MDLVIAKSGSAANPFLNRVHIVQGDIAMQDVDAIAIAVPQNLDYAGRINLRVAEAAKYDIDEFILEHVYRPRAGEVYALPGFGLQARHILLGVMPNYRTEFDINESHLTSVIRRMMELSRSMLLSSVAFPPLYSGRKRFPKGKAARLMLSGIADRLDDGFSDVRLVCPDEMTCEIFARKLAIARGEA